MRTIPAKQLAQRGCGSMIRESRSPTVVVFQNNQDSRSPNALFSNSSGLKMTKWFVFHWIWRCLNRWQDSISPNSSFCQKLSPVDHQMCSSPRTSKMSQQLTGFMIYKCCIFQRIESCGSPSVIVQWIRKCLNNWQGASASTHIFSEIISGPGQDNFWWLTGPPRGQFWNHFYCLLEALHRKPLLGNIFMYIHDSLTKLSKSL